jgi:cytochrome oxidase assembly protein ShyY1
MAAAPHRGRAVWAGLIVLAAFAVLISLGTWQLERKAWKQSLIATLEQRANADPVRLPDAGEWSKLTPADDEYRRVRFTATLDPAQEAYVYTNGSALRKDVSGIGYWVMSPARLPGGAMVVINRGFVPENLKDPKSRPAPASSAISGPVEIIGALRWPEPPGLFTPAGDPGRNTWYARDQVPIVAAKGWGQGAGQPTIVAPFYIEQESPVPVGGAPKPGRLVPHLTDNHLQYAVTWYGLALVLVGVAGAFLLGRRRSAVGGGAAN